jgi:hypothetical protein
MDSDKVLVLDAGKFYTPSIRRREEIEKEEETKPFCTTTQQKMSDGIERCFRF